MRFDLEGNLEALIEIDDPGVIHKSRAHPRRSDLVGGGANKRIQQVGNFCPPDPFGLARGLGFDCNPGLEGLMHTVLAPGLGDRFELHIAGFAALGLVIVLNGLHLHQIERCPALIGKRQQPFLIQFTQRNRLYLPGSLGQQGESWLDLSDGVAMDDMVCQQAAGKLTDIGFGQLRPVHHEAQPGRSAFYALDAQHPGGACHLLGNRVGHAGAQRHFHQPLAGLPFRRLAVYKDTTPLRMLRNGVAEQLLGDSLKVGGVHLSLDKVQVLTQQALHRLHSQGVRIRQVALRTRIASLAWRNHKTCHRQLFQFFRWLHSHWS